MSQPEAPSTTSTSVDSGSFDTAATSTTTSATTTTNGTATTKTTGTGTGTGTALSATNYDYDTEDLLSIVVQIRNVIQQRIRKRPSLLLLIIPICLSLYLSTNERREFAQVQNKHGVGNGSFRHGTTTYKVQGPPPVQHYFQNEDDDEQYRRHTYFNNNDDENVLLYEGMNNNFEEPFTLFNNNLRFRRICSPIGQSSVVCMTIKYPWEIPIQDKSYDFPYPVDERFYNINPELKRTLILLEGDKLEKCSKTFYHQLNLKKQNQQGQGQGNQKEGGPPVIDQLIKTCLDRLTAARGPTPSVVVIFFRHHVPTDKIHVYGTGYGKSLDNLLSFFHGQVIQVWGDSTAPHVTECFRTAFGPCVESPIERSGASFYCGGKHRHAQNRHRQLHHQQQQQQQEESLSSSSSSFNTTNTIINTMMMMENTTTAKKVASAKKKTTKMTSTNITRQRRLVDSRNHNWPWDEMDESYDIFLGMDDYSPVTTSKVIQTTGETILRHVLPEENLIDWILSKGMVRKAGWTELRDLVMIIQYPFAHTQTHDMIYNHWSDVQRIQSEFPDMIMSIQSDAGKAILAEIGWNLKHVIVFDGFPQFFPTRSSAYYGPLENLYDNDDYKHKGKQGEELFLLKHGYPARGNSPGWEKEYGSSCRGPVPTNSIMNHVHQLSRQAFNELGMDMRYYIRNWEFVNQFWWMTEKWITVSPSTTSSSSQAAAADPFDIYRMGGNNDNNNNNNKKNNNQRQQNKKILDCTHGRNGFSCVHKFLLQAMIDDYYDNNQYQ